MSRLLLGGALLSLLCASPLSAKDRLAVRDLRMKRDGQFLYFRLKIDAPKDLRTPDLEKATGEALRRRATQAPQLWGRGGEEAFFLAKGSGTLTFCGRVDAGDRPTRWVLGYPVFAGKVGGLRGVTGDAGRRTSEVRLDWAAAKASQDDLKRQWGQAQVRRLAVLEARAPETGFFTLAREVLGARYKRPTPLLLKQEDSGGARSARLYELTTGAEAITESLALRRASAPRGLDRGDRSVRVSTIPGIDVASHPWEKMMAGRKPAAEPLARLVPEDNYYLTVKNLQTFLDAIDLISRWGGNVTRSFVLHDRDHRLRERYETQLCLASLELVKRIPARLLNGLALTGHDLSLTDGSDVTVLFDATDAKGLVKVLDRFVAREKGKRKDLRSDTSTWRRVAIQSFVTPRREVSLHRAVLGNVVACSNSEEALQRVIDAHAGRADALADAPDFKYMRTVFPRGAKEEDGFAFLSDAFVRQLVGPAGRIGAKRRLEARAALTLATHAALAHGWEHGRLPSTHREMLEGAALKASSLEVPEGKAVFWGPARGQAWSEVYNTLAFTTPLVEVPVRLVTPEEERDYLEFRSRYLGLWRRFFDPVGMRFALGPEKVQVETYILPLVNTSRYNDLRAMASGLVHDDPARFRPGMLGRFLLGSDREWLSLHLEGEQEATRGLVKELIRFDLDPARGRAGYEKAVWRLPLVLTLRTKEPDQVSRFLAQLWKQALRGGGKEIVERKHKGVVICEAAIDANRYRQAYGLLKMFAEADEDNAPLLLTLLLMLPEKEAPKAFYGAIVGKEYYLTWNEEALKRQIDAALLPGKGKPAGDRVNAGLRLSTKGKAADAWGGLLEWQTHKKALGSAAVWEALHRAGLHPRRPEEVIRLLGYVPISPDGTAFEVDRLSGEVSNPRHGSLARPTCRDEPAPGSPAAALLRQLDRVGVQLRFREDGVHTVLTLERTRGK
jgi:hypothetical protein